MKPITLQEAQSIIGGDNDPIYSGPTISFGAEQRDYGLRQIPQEMWLSELIPFLYTSEA